METNWTPRLGLLCITLILGINQAATAAVNCSKAHELGSLVQSLTQTSFNRERLVRDHFDVAEFSEVPSTQLENVREFENRADLFHADWNGQPVIGKKLRRGSLREAAWIQELNKIGLAVKFLGLSKVQGQLYLIVVDVGGVNTQMLMLAPEGFNLNYHLVVEMRRQLKIMIDHRIYPLDLQFQLSRDRKQALIIDPENFQLWAPGTDQSHKTRMALQTVLLNWQMSDHVDADALMAPNL